MKKILFLILFALIVTASIAQITNNSFIGIGVTFEINKDTVILTSIRPEGPANKAGLKEGDKLLFVDGKKVAGIGLKEEDVANMLQGKKGTVVKLKIQRQHAISELLIVRDKIVELTPTQDNDGNYGYWDGEKWSIKPVYLYAFDFGIDGLALVVQLDGKHGFIDRTGKTAIPFHYDQAYPFTDFFTNREQLAAVRINDKWGFINKNGTTVIPFRYDNVLPFLEGLAAVKINNKWGYVDVQGKMIIPAEYDTTEGFFDGVASASKNGVTTLIANPLQKESANNNFNIFQKSDVDINIPVNSRTNVKTFAFIVANENYGQFTALYSLNDGEIMKEYCVKTLGIPDNNIWFYENATYGNLAGIVKRIKEIADVFDGEAKIIFYYAGLCLPDEKNNLIYLFPTDGSMNNIISTGYSLPKFIEELATINVKLATIILDAPMNGTNRDGKTLTSSRGVAIKRNRIIPTGNTIILSATTDGVAYQDEKLSHGLFTYFLLKKIQDTQGNVSYKDLMDFVISEVKRKSVSQQIQVPSVLASEQLKDWQFSKIK
jgi:hypothetical protein